MEKRLEEYKPIGSDTIKIYGFRFGAHRYQVEHFNHDHSETPEEGKIKCISYYDSLYGTRVYKFDDSDMWGPAIHSVIFLNRYIEKDELKQKILDDVIDWKFEDPYDFKDRFCQDKYDYLFNTLFQRDKGDVKLPYPECKPPYDKCPICGGELDESVLEPEDAVDVFNSHVGTNYWGEPDGWWHEVHRCPHCDKLFFIEESC